MPWDDVINVFSYFHERCGSSQRYCRVRFPARAINSLSPFTSQCARNEFRSDIKPGVPVIPRSFAKARLRSMTVCHSGFAMSPSRRFASRPTSPAIFSRSLRA